MDIIIQQILRVFKVNDWNIYELFNKSEQAQLKEKRILNLRERSINQKVISKTASKLIGNILVIADSRTWC